MISKTLIMKRIFFFLSFLLLPIFLIAQKKFFVEPIINPLLVPIGNTGFEEYGLGEINFNYKENTTQEYALLVGRKFFNGKFGAGIGFSHKNYRIDYDYINLEPEQGYFIPREVEGYIDYSFFGLRFFTEYNFSKKFSARLTIEANDPYRIKRNRRSNDLSQLVYVGQGMNDLEFEFYRISREAIMPSGDPYSYAIPELNFSYNVYNKLNILLGVKYKFTKNENFWTYRLLIYESTDINTGDIRVLNDSRIYPKFLFLYAGISYQLGFGKKMKGKRKKA